MRGLREISVDGHRLAVLPINPNTPGKPIILLHGITLSVRYWTTETVLTKFGPCYAISLPGHYPATAPPEFNHETISPQVIAKVLSEAIRQLVGEQSVLLVGHSTGGFSALCMAIFEPDVPCAIISLAGFTRGKWLRVYGLNQWLSRRGNMGKSLVKTFTRLNLSTPRMFRMGIHMVATANHKTLTTYPRLDYVLNYMYRDIRQLDLDVIVEYYSKMPEIDITHLLHKVNVPTLVITGDRDPVVSPAQTKIIAQHIPNSDIAIVKGAGHMLPMENPQAYDDIISTWVQKNGMCKDN